MMHTGIAAGPSGAQMVQLCISRRRVQISTFDGSAWSARARDVRLRATGETAIELELRGRTWLIELDDPDRFRWQFLPRWRQLIRRRSRSVAVLLGARPLPR